MGHALFKTVLYRSAPTPAPMQRSSPGVQRLVLLVLAHEGSDAGICWLSKSELAELTGLSERAVVAAIKALAASGEIEVRKTKIRCEGATYRQNLYRIMLPDLPAPDLARDGYPECVAVTIRDLLPTELSARGALTVNARGALSVNAPGALTPARERERVPIQEEQELRAREEEQELRAELQPPIGPPSLTLIAAPPAQPLSLRPDNHPVTVDRKPCTDTEYEQAVAVLAEFNRLAGTRYNGKDWIAKIVMRLREQPGCTLEGHALIIRNSLAHPWWRGIPSPSVIYGNGALFEKAMHEAAAEAATPQVLTAADYEALIESGRHDAVASSQERP